MMIQDSKPSKTRTYRIKKNRAAYVDTVTTGEASQLVEPVVDVQVEPIAPFVVTKNVEDNIAPNPAEIYEENILRTPSTHVTPTSDDTSKISSESEDSALSSQENERTDSPENDDVSENDSEFDLNENEYNYILESIPQPDRWAISSPIDKELPDLLNFMRNGEIIAVLTLSDDNMRALIPTLKNYYPDENTEPKKPFLRKVVDGWKKHKITGTLLAVVVAIVLGNIITGFVLNGIW